MIGDLHPAPDVTTSSGPYRPRLAWRHLAPRHLGSWLLLGLLWLCAFLPFALTRGVGAALGAVMRAGNRKRREIARVNLGLCFPDLPEPERERMLRRHFRVSGQAYLDLGLLAFAPAWRVRAAVRIEGIEHYLEPLRSGRPVILLVPHTMGMNFTGALLAAEHPMFGLIKPVADPVMDWLLQRGRMRFGCVLYLKNFGLRQVVRALRERSTFYYLPDEDHGPRHSLFAPFFGVPTATLNTLGRLAHMAGAAAVPCFTRLTGSGYVLRFEPALTGFPTGDDQRDAETMNRVLEQGLRDMPEQYMWTFKLFRTRPGGAPSPYAR
ncbi:MAG: lysophospholipid acyltransferase family protein [Pseudomonadota bacterium]